MMPSRRLFAALRAGFRFTAGLLALAFTMQLLLAVTGLPSGLVAWICGRRLEAVPTASFVVVLGGGGIPSESGLMRTYHAAVLDQVCSNTVFIVSLPARDDPETSHVGRMRDELVMRGIEPRAIRMEHRAVNTHAQARAVRAMLRPEDLHSPLVLVTSPTHVRRAVLCFRQAGFTRVSAAAADGTGVDADLGRGLGARYGFWNNLEFQIRVVRELVALLYYRLRGWI
jgi:uncharacterized SAM-binding protein YcdF (DUF218 family)